MKKVVWDANVKRYRDENGEFTDAGLDRIYAQDNYNSALDEALKNEFPDSYKNSVLPQDVQDRYNEIVQKGYNPSSLIEDYGKELRAVQSEWKVEKNPFKKLKLGDRIDELQKIILTLRENK